MTRQGEIIRGLVTPLVAVQADVSVLAKALLREMRGTIFNVPECFLFLRIRLQYGEVGNIGSHGKLDSPESLDSAGTKQQWRIAVLLQIPISRYSVSVSLGECDPEQGQGVQA